MCIICYIVNNLFRTRKVEVVLMKETPNLGVSGVKVKVAAGYMRNYLVYLNLFIRK